MTDPFAVIAAIGVVPVIAIENADDAIPLADALLEGGLPIAEVTFRTPAAARVLARLSAERPRLLAGAGTLLDLNSLAAARDSGARFGVAPGFDARIVEEAAKAKFPFAPGVMTPSDVSAAAKHGVRIAKFFPAGAAGGPKALEAVAAPFAHLGFSFMPTGGVSLDNLGAWLKLKSVIAVGGTWIARAQDIKEGRFAEIAQHARAAVEKAKALREARG
ncbi:MAG: bifunctional 4-hydroxy-2-oxoglutarate aldolase/2-dehydro-3-deoxy-phosphogluconate aldolase [Hyphomicrobiales bacterium]|nr:bifunctional 4-hydroxy-2-oxoglutarate aldolase/2-dehydro-3-deoxy-phosphogluconate aldolase [Hyphomicrobiales bacterium]MBV9112340.1 bifunctional 4-hydroxy-2-oxoglutarate aldolase/2-dehydro-3-deoxy-phosphogluconate aldolase [Hyphomicrobiales bacterium]MBV9520962.1 bifunctional 4-hydroxy-2-oxoglutarate aldolase/2-dehydro-3-deoxy-phosphogluconate aldolase [Hyphomicrobiales bacterium]